MVWAQLPSFAGGCFTRCSPIPRSIAYKRARRQSAKRFCRHLERRLPVSGRERCPGCHPERSEGSLRPASQILRCAQDDRRYLQMSSGFGVSDSCDRWLDCFGRRPSERRPSGITQQHLCKSIMTFFQCSYVKKLIAWVYSCVQSPRLHCWQIALVEDDQPGDAAHKARDHQYPGVPPGQLMEDERVDSWRIVERAGFE
jgi:hypothetical protein